VSAAPRPPRTDVKIPAENNSLGESGRIEKRRQVADDSVHRRVRISIVDESVHAHESVQFAGDGSLSDRDDSGMRFEDGYVTLPVYGARNRPPLDRHPERYNSRSPPTRATDAALAVNKLRWIEPCWRDRLLKQREIGAPVVLQISPGVLAVRRALPITHVPC